LRRDENVDAVPFVVATGPTLGDSHGLPMDPLEAIRRAQATRLVDEDGDEVELAPALPQADIESLVDEVGVPPSRELRALLERTAGIDGGPLDTIDFTGRSLSFGAPEIFPWDSRSRETASATSGLST
jgi:hypothetical protein